MRIEPLQMQRDRKRRGKSAYAQTAPRARGWLAAERAVA
jgi:hypothetical protein